MSRGSIKERSKGSFTVTIELPRDPVSNKRRQQYFSVKGTRKDAEKLLTEKLRELDTGLLIDKKKVKYNEYLDYWIEKTFDNLEITTQEGYIQKIERHIKPYIGNLYLEDIRPLHLQSLYDQLLKNGKVSRKR